MTAAILSDMATLNGQLARISLSEPVTTPEDYAEIAFKLPRERYVGLLACQIDPNLRELEAYVTRCEKRTSTSEALVSRSNGKAKGKQNGKALNEEMWEIELSDTALFPEGGGQATDTGLLAPLGKPSATPIVVKEVVRRNLAAVHICTSPVEVGQRVLVKVDWTRRHDSCTQHTAQHLLSAVFEHHFKLDTVGWALSAFPELSYIELPRKPTQEELAEAEQICNDLIVEGRRVRVEFEIAKEDSRPSTLPADYIGGVVRHVIIDNLDRNPCCGTHYHSLAPLQGIHVSRATTPIRGTNTRVYFIAGPRVISQLTTGLSVLRDSSLIMSCSNDDLPSRIQTLSDNAKELGRREKRMRDELAEMVASQAIDKARSQSKDGHLIAALVREEDATNDVDFLSLVSTKIKERLSGEKAYTFAIAHSGHGNAVPDGCLVVFSSDEAVAARISEEIKKGESQLCKRLKGGGKGRWQGKLVSGRFSRDRDEKDLLILLGMAW